MRRYFIIEKDSNTVAAIKEVLMGYVGFLYAGDCCDADQALDHILKHTVDIVFIDMDCTLDNLQVFLLDIAQYTVATPIIIGLSISKEQAYTAYQYNFFGFILKPLIKLNIRKNIANYVRKFPDHNREVICLKSNKDYHYLNMDEILFLKADNNTTDFYLKDGDKVSAYKTLKSFQEHLPENFLRIHKSYIINSRWVSRIHYGKNICVIKRPLHKIPFTKTFIENIDTINNSLLKESA